MEIQTAAAEMGWRQAEEAQKRWLMYGLHGGDVITMKADFIKDPAVAKILQTADVVVSVLPHLTIICTNVLVASSRVYQAATDLC